MEEFDQDTKDEISKKVEKLRKSKMKQIEIPNWRPVNSI
jgi:hypothetical protein